MEKVSAAAHDIRVSVVFKDAVSLWEYNVVVR